MMMHVKRHENIHSLSSEDMPRVRQSAIEMRQHQDIIDDSSLSLSHPHSHHSYHLISLDSLSMPLLHERSSSDSSAPVYSSEYDHNFNSRSSVLSIDRTYQNMSNNSDTISVNSKRILNEENEREHLSHAISSSSGQAHRDEYLSYPKSLLPKILTEWKLKFLAGEFKSVPPHQYTIVERPTGVQFRSPLWVSGVLLRKNDSKDMKWFCVASDACLSNQKCYSASKSNSKVVKHLVLCHGYTSSRTPTSNQYGSSKRKYTVSSDDDDEGNMDMSRKGRRCDPNHPIIDTSSLNGSPIDQRKFPTVNQLEVELSLALKCVETFESFKSIDSEKSQSLYKLMSPFTTFNSAVFKQVLLKIHSQISSKIINDLAEAKKNSDLPVISLNLCIRDLPSNEMPSSLVLIVLRLSFVNGSGVLREQVIGAKIYSPQLCQQFPLSDQVGQWITHTLSDFNCSSNDILSYSVTDRRIKPDNLFRCCLRNLFSSIPCTVPLLDSFNASIIEMFCSFNNAQADFVKSLITKMVDVSDEKCLKVLFCRDVIIHANQLVDCPKMHRSILIQSCCHFVPFDGRCIRLL